MRPVVVKTFYNYIPAHIISGRLKDAGIDSHLFDETSVTMAPFLGSAIGGIKLAVDEADEVQARNLLSLYEDEYRRAAICPKCGANEIVLLPKKSAGNIATALLTWVFSNYAVSVDHVYTCARCGYETETLPDPPEDYENKDLL